MTDLSDLPAEVRTGARIDHNGEVSWSDSAAAAAINALTANGRVVLGLDVRFYDSTARFYEIPWSSFEPDLSKTPLANAESSRQAALEALKKIDELERPDDTVEVRVLVTWQ